MHVDIYGIHITPKGQYLLNSQYRYFTQNVSDIKLTVVQPPNQSFDVLKEPCVLGNTFLMVDRREAATLSLVMPVEFTPSPLSTVYSLPYLPDVTLNNTLIYIHTYTRLLSQGIQQCYSILPFQA
jgi:hypothetical protein